MSYITKLFIFVLLIFIDNQYVSAFNETCGTNQPPCSNPLTCINGYCLCSKIGRTTDEKQPLSFWDGNQCIPCALHYQTSGTKCYNLILGKATQMNWDRARDKCQESGGDLLVIRSSAEFNFISSVIQTIPHNDMYQRTPRNGTLFASVWIGAKLAEWKGDGKFNLVAHGPILTKKSHYWCSQTSPLEQEPNYVGLNTTGERQACIGLAFFKSGLVCMHDWFCSWDTYTLCEIHPPPPPTIATELEALEEKPKSKRIYMIIGGIILILLLISIGIFYIMCNKKKSRRRSRAFGSVDSGMSQESAY